MKVAEIAEDLELRPYFIEFISRIVALGLTDTFEVNDVDRVGFDRKYQEAFLNLSHLMIAKTKNENIGEIVEEVCQQYLDKLESAPQLSVPSVSNFSSKSIS